MYILPTSFTELVTSVAVTLERTFTNAIVLNYPKKNITGIITALIDTL